MFHFARNVMTFDDEIEPIMRDSSQDLVDIQKFGTEMGTDRQSVPLLCAPKQATVSTCAPPRLPFCIKTSHFGSSHFG